MNNLSILVTGLLFLPLMALAQKQDAPLPKPPFLRPLPDNTILTIKVTNQDTSAKMAPGARVVNELIITKSGSTRELASVWTDGSRSEIWLVNKYRVEETPLKSITVTPLPAGGDAEYADFPDLRWLNLSNYIGMENNNEHICYHFQMEKKLLEPHINLVCSAYIDIKTQRPVSWDVGPNHFEVTSIEDRDSSEPLVLPKAFSEKLNAYRQAAEMANAYKKQP